MDIAIPVQQRANNPEKQTRSCRPIKSLSSAPSASGPKHAQELGRAYPPRKGGERLPDPRARARPGKANYGRSPGPGWLWGRSSKRTRADNIRSRRGVRRRARGFWRGGKEGLARLSRWLSQLKGKSPEAAYGSLERRRFFFVRWGFRQIHSSHCRIRLNYILEFHKYAAWEFQKEFLAEVFFFGKWLWTRFPRYDIILPRWRLQLPIVPNSKCIRFIELKLGGVRGDFFDWQICFLFFFSQKGNHFCSEITYFPRHASSFRIYFPNLSRSIRMNR